jgi:Protein of unknown function (DUF3040)
MSLSAREQQALDSITDRLAGSDPKLAALLTGFTRLVSGEEMPLRERIQPGSRRAIRCPRRKRQPPRGDGARRMSRRLGFQWAAVLLSLLTAVTVIAVTTALNHGKSQGPCTTFWAAACGASAPAGNSRPASHKTVTNQAAHQGAVGT